MEKTSATELILGGGGIKAIAYLGYLSDINTVFSTFTGTSAGAVLALLLSVGYSAKVLSSLIFKINFIELRDIDYLGFFSNKGLETGNKFIEYLKKLVRQRVPFQESLTFKEHFEKTGKRLRVTSINLNQKKVVTFDYLEYPDLCIFKAVRMSVSIPFVFTEQIYNNETYIDGIYLPKNIEKEFLALSLPDPKGNSDTFYSFCLNVISLIHPEPPKGTIIIDTLDIDTLNFNLDRVTKIKLLEIGRAYLASTVSSGSTVSSSSTVSASDSTGDFKSCSAGDFKSCSAGDFKVSSGSDSEVCSIITS